MKPKYYLNNYNFDPSPTNSIMQSFEDLDSYCQDVASVDFITEDGDTKLAKEISKVGDNIESNVSYLMSETANSISLDFETKFNLYVGLAAQGIIEEPFPFKSWADEINQFNKNTKSKIDIDIYNVLEGILEIYKSNTNESGLSQINLAYFLTSELDENKTDGKYFLTLQYLVNQFNENIALEEVLNCKTFSESMKSLSKSHSPTQLKDLSVKAMKYALTMQTNKIDTNLSFDDVVKKANEYETNKNKIEELKLICESFKESELWKLISNDCDELDKFFAKFTTEHLSAKTFFQLDNVQNYSRIYRVKKIKHDSIYTFVETVIDGNVEMAEKFLTHIEKSMPKHNTPLNIEFNELKDKVTNITNYHNLNKSLMENNTNQKRKMKI